MNYTEKEIKNIKDHAFDRGFYVGLAIGFISIIVILFATLN